MLLCFLYLFLTASILEVRRIAGSSSDQSGPLKTSPGPPSFDRFMCHASWHRSKYLPAGARRSRSVRRYPDPMVCSNSISISGSRFVCKTHRRCSVLVLTGGSRAVPGAGGSVSAV